MEYTSRTVRCNEPGLTQEQALASLYSHYGESIRVSSVKRRGDAWVVTFQQKVAEFPPKSEDEGGESEAPEPADDAPADDAPADDAPDGPPVADGPPSDSDSGEPKKKDPQAEILHLLHEIAQALGVGGGIDDKLPPEGDLPGPPPPGPDAGLDGLGAGPGPDGPPAGGAPAPKKPTKLRPGEVLPNQTPIGAPAFASTKKAATITVESDKCDPRQYRASQAEADLNAAFAADGYKVQQLKFDRTASVYRALLSIH